MFVKWQKNKIHDAKWQKVVKYLFYFHETTEFYQMKYCQEFYLPGHMYNYSNNIVFPASGSAHSSLPNTEQENISE